MVLEIILPKALDNSDIRTDLRFARENGIELYWLYWLIEEIILSPENIDEYYQNIIRKNEKYLSRLFFDFSASFYGLDDAAIVSIGSHPRLESCPYLPTVNPIDIIILSQDSAQDELVSRLRSQDNTSHLPPINPVIESVVLNGNKNLSSIDGNGIRFWPSRLIDTYTLAGDSQLAYTAIELLRDEWGKSEKVRNAFDKQMKEFKKLLATGNVGNRKSFDISTGTIFFSPDQNIFGLKFAVLRTIQLACDRIILSRHRDTYQTRTSTVDKIRQCFPNHPELEHIYKQVLFMYHWQQFKHSLAEDSTLRIDQQKLQEIITSVSEIVRLEDALSKW